MTGQLFRLRRPNFNQGEPMWTPEQTGKLGDCKVGTHSCTDALWASCLPRESLFLMCTERRPHTAAVSSPSPSLRKKRSRQRHDRNPEDLRGSTSQYLVSSFFSVELKRLEESQADLNEIIPPVTQVTYRIQFCCLQGKKVKMDHHTVLECREAPVSYWKSL